MPARPWRRCAPARAHGRSSRRRRRARPWGGPVAAAKTAWRLLLRLYTFLDALYSGMLSVPFEKVIWSAAAGGAGVSGTFCGFGTPRFVDDRGAVPTTRLGGSAPARARGA